MAAQQVQLLETIRGMKAAMKRQAPDGDSDSDYALNHRATKLKSTGRLAHRARLDNTGRPAHRKRIEHAGYTRDVLSTNPPLFDDDGDPYSPTSSDAESARRHAEPLDDDPYAGVRLETILRPLTAASDLPDHPSLSLPYTAKALTRMADEALEMLRRERASLWKAKRLLQRFRGDGDWVPCETFETTNDELLLNVDDGMPREQTAAPSLDMDQLSLGLGPPTGQQPDDAAGDQLPNTVAHAESEVALSGQAMEGIETPTEGAVLEDNTQDGGVGQQTEGARNLDIPGTVQPDDGEQQEARDTSMKEDETTDQAPNPAVADIAEREAASETASNSNGTSTHAMTTRARARSPAERSDRTPSPSPSDSASVPAVHPWFIPPATSFSDRDLGLPPGEAEETRKLLLLYVQKQEQIVRSLDALHAGLQKPDRLRQYVYRSCKAEGHVIPDGKGNMVTEMSDGEDWYDVADWNLQPWELNDGKLEKGKDEVEDVEEEGKRRPGRGRRVNRM